jgi:hypothetical protein
MRKVVNTFQICVTLPLNLEDFHGFIQHVYANRLTYKYHLLPDLFLLAFQNNFHI